MNDHQDEGMEKLKEDLKWMFGGEIQTKELIEIKSRLDLAFSLGHKQGRKEQHEKDVEAVKEIVLRDTFTPKDDPLEALQSVAPKD